MSLNETYLAVVPARGGSKGIPLKNIVPLNGRPLLCYTLDALSESSSEIDIAVSTDSAEIAAVAAGYPGVYVLQRPEALSVDNASTESALLNAIEQMENLTGKNYSVVLTVQPTSPLRKSSTVDAFIDRFEELAGTDEADALLTLHESRADYWIKDDRQGFSRLYPEAPRRRQDREPIYLENGCLYGTKVDSLEATGSVLGTRCTGFLVDEVEAIDINEPIDLVYAEALIGEKPAFVTG